MLLGVCVSMYIGSVAVNLTPAWASRSLRCRLGVHQTNISEPFKSYGVAPSMLHICGCGYRWTSDPEAWVFGAFMFIVVLVAVVSIAGTVVARWYIYDGDWRCVLTDSCRILK